MTPNDRVTYASYLQLPAVLNAQRAASGHSDEMLFIILHQTMELWMKQLHIEINSAQHLIVAGELIPAYKPLARVSRVQGVMTQAWDVLATMTPADYEAFRSVLGTSSGFQSSQFRALEYRLGIKDPRFLGFQEEGSPERLEMEAALDRAGLYDSVLEQLAAATRVDFPPRPRRTPYEASAAVKEAWLLVYRNTGEFWSLYQLAEKLVDIDDCLLTWRYRHAVTVERVIGMKRGTGGSDGVSYLQATLSRRAFPELWSLRTRL